MNSRIFKCALRNVLRNRCRSLVTRLTAFFGALGLREIFTPPQVLMSRLTLVSDSRRLK